MDNFSTGLFFNVISSLMLLKAPCMVYFLDQLNLATLDFWLTELEQLRTVNQLTIKSDRYNPTGSQNITLYIYILTACVYKKKNAQIKIPIQYFCRSNSSGKFCNLFSFCKFASFHLVARFNMVQVLRTCICPLLFKKNPGTSVVEWSLTNLSPVEWSQNR